MVTSHPPEPKRSIREYDPANDEAALRRCFVALQDHEHAMVPATATGAELVDVYVPWMLDRVARHAGAVFVAEEDGAVVGFVAVLGHVPRAEPDDSDVAHAFVSELSVLDHARGRGIGRALLERAEAFAREAGATNVRVAIVAGNQGARRLYERAGFSPSVLTLRKPV